MFKNSQTSITDEERLGCLSTSTTEKNIKQVHAMSLHNQPVTINDLVNHLRVSHGSAHEIIQDRQFVQDLFQNNRRAQA
jgi:hypothetical protein